MSQTIIEKIKSQPHWRFIIKPEQYVREFIDSLHECEQIIQSSTLRLRAWDFPYLSRRDEDRSQGETWIECWTDLTYWRFYQSGQFIYLSVLREVADSTFDAQLRNAMKGHLRGTSDTNVDEIRGFLDFANTVFSATECFEFAARLCQHAIYPDGAVNITVGLDNIQGIALGMDAMRSWHRLHMAGQHSLSKTWTLQPAELVADSANYAVDAAKWLLERFGWLDPNVEQMKIDQQSILGATT